MLPGRCALLASGGFLASQGFFRAPSWGCAPLRRVSVIRDHIRPSLAVRRFAALGVASREGMERGLVSCEWVNAQLAAGATDIRLVDATWYLPNSPFAAPEGSDGAQADFDAGPRIPGSVFFDIDGVAEAHPNGVPHMLPSAETFAAAMAALGIEKTTRVVVYDRHGVFSSPRLWYTLKAVFGHPSDVAVLDGGLPKWTSLGFPIETGAAPLPPPPAPMSTWEKKATAAWDVEEVRTNIEKRVALLVDARPAGRFTGAVPEPRPGMRGGSVPGSVNVPFLDVLTAPPELMMRSADEIREKLRAAGVVVEDLAATQSEVSVVTSCGSGLTACVVGLAMHQVGLPLSKWAVYDGAWVEWGGRPDTPIVKKGADGSDEVVP